jgi:hypothetical protein
VCVLTHICVVSDAGASARSLDGCQTRHAASGPVFRASSASFHIVTLTARTHLGCRQEGFSSQSGSLVRMASPSSLLQSREDDSNPHGQGKLRTLVNSVSSRTVILCQHALLAAVYDHCVICAAANPQACCRPWAYGVLQAASHAYPVCLCIIVLLVLGG